MIILKIKFLSTENNTWVTSIEILLEHQQYSFCTTGIFAFTDIIKLGYHVTVPYKSQGRDYNNWELNDY